MKTSTCRSCGAEIRPVTFWANVEKTEGCWLWRKGRNRAGYGVQCHALAHRLAWEFAVGAVPDGMNVLHHCDNPPCVRPGPGHLFLGTQAVNMADMDAKGRRRTAAAPGEENPNALLTDELVEEIRRLYGPARGQGVKRHPSQAELAALLGLSRAVVCDVVRRKSWRHVA